MPSALGKKLLEAEPTTNRDPELKILIRHWYHILAPKYSRIDPPMDFIVLMKA
jgi:hypothetical protein